MTQHRFALSFVGTLAFCLCFAFGPMPEADSAEDPPAATAPDEEVPAMSEQNIAQKKVTGPYLMVLGIAQDAGVPQAGRRDDPAWADSTQRRMATSLALVEPETGKR